MLEPAPDMFPEMVVTALGNVVLPIDSVVGTPGPSVQAPVNVMGAAGAPVTMSVLAVARVGTGWGRVMGAAASGSASTAVATDQLSGPVPSDVLLLMFIPPLVARMVPPL